MRRALALAAILLIMLAVGLTAGWWISRRAAPARIEAALAARLGEAIGLPVEIGALRPSIRWGLVLEARDVRARAPDGTSPIEVAALWLRLDLSAWLRGDPQLHWIAVQDAVVRLERRPGGLALAGSAEEPEHEDEPVRALLGWLEATAPSLLETPELEHLELRGLRVEIRAPGQPSPDVVLAGLQLRLQEGLFGRPGRIDATGALALGEAAPAGATLRATLGPSAEARLELRGLELGALPAAFGDAARGLTGTADARLRWQPGLAPGALHVAVEARDLVCCGGEPARLRLAEASFAVGLEADSDRLRLRDAVLRLAGVHATGAAAFGLPLRASSPLELDVTLAATPLVRLERSLGLALPFWRERVGWLRERLRAGTLETATLTLAAPLERVPELLRAQPARAGESLGLTAAVADVSIDVGPGAGLEGLTGGIRWTGPALALDDLDGRYDGSALPRLQARFEGLRSLGQADLPCARPESVPPLRGRRDLFEWLGGPKARQRSAASAPAAREASNAPRASWRLDLSESELRHPALLCVLHAARGHLRPAPPGVAFSLDEGRWAGLAVRAEGAWRTGDAEAVEMTVRLAPPRSRRQPPGRPGWASGRFDLQIERMGPWQTEWARGRYSLEGARLRFDEARVALRPAGSIEGDLEVALGAPAPLPWTLRFALPPVAIADFAAAGGRSAALLDGTLIGSGQLTGALEPGLSAVLGASGLVALHARNGVVHRGLPPILAMTLASDRLNPFSGRESIPYAAIDLVGDIEAGRLRTRGMSLDGPALRMLAEGEISLVAPHEVEAVVGVFFFRVLDRVIGKVPLLNRMLLGPDENLVSAYFALTGPLSEPEARLVPVKSLASGPASVVLEGLPAFVRTGLSRLQSIFPLGGSSEDS